MNWTSYNIDMLYEWIENGQISSVSEEFAKYVNMLSKIFNMKQRFDIYGDKEAIIKHLIAFEPDIKGNRVQALKLYNEAMEYYYGDVELPKNVLRNMAAARVEKDAQMARLTAEGPDGFEKASKIEERAFKMRQLDQKDEEKLPDLIYQKPNKVYTLNMDMFEIGNVPKDEIEQFIDQNVKGLPVKAIERIKQEALISKIKVFEDDGEDSRK